MDEELIKNIRNMAITKQLNFLIGSGTSVPAIPLMKNKSYRPKGKEDTEWNELNCEDKSQIAENLNMKTKLISQEILKGSKEVQKVQETYDNFLQAILDILNLSNSRQTPKNANIFTTNYDLFIEKAADNILNKNRLIFNDGASGYFNRYLSSSNYNRLVAYKGLNDNFIAEIPSISLIKPHGSVNWEKVGNNIEIKDSVTSNPVIVPPTGYESAETFLQNHFYDMLRVFETELDKQQSVLFIIGFSFQDKHIGKMIKRAMQNPELMIYAFGYSNEDKQSFLNNLDLKETRDNFKVLVPNDFDDEFCTINHDESNNKWYSFILKNLKDVLSNTPNVQSNISKEDLNNVKK